MSMSTTEPRTHAGRAFWSNGAAWAGSGPLPSSVLTAILAIEAEAAQPIDLGEDAPRENVEAFKKQWQAMRAEAAQPIDPAQDALLPLMADRLTAIIESRMSRDLAWLDDDGKTVLRLNPEEAGSHIAWLYRTGDVVSGLLALPAAEAAQPIDLERPHEMLHAVDCWCDPLRLSGDEHEHD
jgi:hypothetical protein